MGYSANARIWESIHAMARARRYEFPLVSALNAQHLGEVMGTSVCMSREMEVEYVELDLNLYSLDAGIETARLVLETAGAPAGSEFRVRRDSGEQVIRFGVQEGLAIYLDGINLPDEIYDTCTCDGLAVLISGELASVGGEIRGSWVGRSETSIYMYGPNAEQMFAAIEPILTVYPLCRNARVVIRHGNPALNPRTVKLPENPGIDAARMIFRGGQHGTG
ncbi:MAG: hypothetical protein VB050_01335 [Geobacteraceae bacterium]|nr:hypothetical protein [Geobacteraceae bacterium]